MLLHRQLRESIDEPLDLTPMVDVVFQLLTFLLLTYRAPVGGEVQVPPARYGIGIDEANAVVLTVAPPPAPGEPAVVTTRDRTGRTVALEDAEAIRSAVAEGVREGRRRVILQADGAVPHGEILRLAATAAEIEGVLLHIGVEEP